MASYPKAAVALLAQSPRCWAVLRVHPTEDENTFICQQGSVSTWHSSLYLPLLEEIYTRSEVIFPSQHYQTLQQISSVS